MDYHLHHEGRDLGVLPLEELRRRRQSGELSGTEYVWREGMAEWQTLDSILGPPAPAAAPPPVPAITPKTTRAKFVWVSVTVILAIAGAVITTFMVTKAVRRLRLAQQRVGAPERAEITKEVTWTKKTATEADVRKRAGEFRRRQWLEGYKANADHGTPCDAEALEMIETWIESNFGDAKTNAPDISLWCDKLAAMPGCDDPLLLTVTALNCIELHEKNRRLERALAGFKTSRHKAYPKLTAAVNLIDSTDNTNQIRALLNSSIGWFGQAFRDGSFRPEDQAEIAEILVNGWGYNFFYRVRSTICATPRTAGKPFEWLASVLDGEYNIMEAWKARGGGYANTVSEQGWEGFRTHLAAARKSLTHAWQLRPDLPLAPCRLIYVELGDSDAEQMRLWFDRTVAAQIDYAKAWSEMRWGLRPRWHGSLEAMLALGKTAVNTRRFDTDVPRKFVDVIADLESELEVPFGQHIYGRPDIWPEIARMYDGYIAEPSQEKSRAGWRSSYATIAYLAKKYDVAREQLEALDWQPLPAAWGWGTDLSLMPLEVAARTGPAATNVSPAETRYRRGDVDEALRRYKELAEATDVDARTLKFAQHRIAALELEKRLAAGEWIDLLPSGTNDPAWEISFGTVRRSSDGPLEVEAARNGHMLFSRARVGLAFEVRGEFEKLKSSTDDFQAGLVMGLPNFNNTDWYAFRMKRNRDEGDIASFSRGWTKTQIAKPVGLSTRNTFQFQFQNGEATATVNGKRVLQRSKLKGALRASESEFLVGLGAFNDMNETVVRYHKIQLRRLAPARPATEKEN